MVHETNKRWAAGLLLCSAALFMTACGGGYHDDYYDPIGEVEVDNQTDLVPPLADVTYFEMAPVGVVPSGDLLFADVLPGEIQFIGEFFEDVYDAFAELDLGLSGGVEYFDVFIEAGFVTTFEVF